MCDPNTTGQQAIGQSSAVLGAGGALTGGVGAYFSALSQKNSMTASAQVANINAQASEAAANSAMVAGGRQQQQIMMNVSNAVGTETAEYGAHGIVVNGGSAGAVKASSEIVGGVDEAQANANAVRQAWGFKTQAVNFQNQSLVDTATAKGINPFMAGGSTMLTGAASVAQSYYKMMNAGVNTSSSGPGGGGSGPGSGSSQSPVIVPSPYTQLTGTTNTSGGY